MHPPHSSPPPLPARSRVAELRLPSDLPPRDLERLADVSALTQQAPVSAPATFNLSHKFPHNPISTTGDGSPADVRVYSPAVAPLLMRGVTLSPNTSSNPGLVLPNLSLPLSSPLGLTTLPPVGSALSRDYSNPRRRTSRPSPTGCLTAPTSPANTTVAGLSQNEIKKAQNRKSAKRFREAQKQRWKNMADDLLVHKKTISELRAKLAQQENEIRRTNLLIEATSGTATSNRGRDLKRSGMAINDLLEAEHKHSNIPLSSPVTPPPTQAHVESEAALYAQILSNTTQKPPHAVGPQQPYVAEIGLLQLCYVVMASTSRVVSIRRGSPNSFATFAVDGLSLPDANEFRAALTCGKPVAVAFSRHGVRINAVMNPVDTSDRVVVAEFSPLQ